MLGHINSKQQGFISSTMLGTHKFQTVIHQQHDAWPQIPNNGDSSAA
jgi:hypothetical protein